MHYIIFASNKNEENWKDIKIIFVTKEIFKTNNFTFPI